jgi:psiF repeat.
MLKTVIAAAALSLLALAPAHAAEKAKSTSQHAPSAAQLAQRQRMKDCNAKAGTDKLMGAERKAFMKQCLSKAGHAAAMAKGHAAASAGKMAQRERMKTCNAQAKTDKLAGAKRKAFMKQCLSNSK